MEIYSILYCIAYQNEWTAYNFKSSLISIEASCQIQQNFIDIEGVTPINVNIAHTYTDKNNAMTKFGSDKAENNIFSQW